MPNLDALFHPKSIAIIGASNDPTRGNGRTLRYLQDAGYPGRVYPVNPTRDTVQGMKSYPSILGLPEAPDVAIVAVPASTVLDTTRDCGKAGVKVLIIFSSGFAELGEEGAAQQAEIANIASGTGMRVLGPNCQGMYDVHSRAVLTFSATIDGGLPASGGIALISQSGGYAGQIQKIASQRGLAIGKWVATGNECDIDTSELIEAMAYDPDISMIMTYMEGNRSGHRLIRALEAAQAARKPVIAIKVGRTEAGGIAVASHTASLAGGDAIYDMVFKGCGVYRADGIEEMIDIAYSLKHGSLPRGRRVAILTGSGGFAVQMTDYASSAGLTLPTVPMDIQRELRAMIPYSATSNPVDMTGQVMNDLGIYAKAFELLLGCDEFDSVAVFLGMVGAMPSMADKWLETLAPGARRFPHKTKVLCALLPPGLLPEYEKAGFIVFEDAARMMRALSAITEISAGFDSIPPRKIAYRAPLSGSPGNLPELKTSRSYSEAEAKQILAEAGVPIPGERIVKNAAEAVSAAEALGWPVAAKIVSPDILHKTEVGGVCLDINDAASLRKAIKNITASVKSALPDARVDGYLITPMIADGIDCLVGIKQDPVFGPVIVFGAGGVLTELLADTAMRLAPVTLEEAHAMMAETRVFQLLKGHRGKPGADTDALANAIVAVSLFAVSRGANAISSVEINPLRVLESGHGVLALDALLVTR